MRRAPPFFLHYGWHPVTRIPPNELNVWVPLRAARFMLGRKWGKKKRFFFSPTSLLEIELESAFFTSSCLLQLREGDERE